MSTSDERRPNSAPSEEALTLEWVRQAQAGSSEAFARLVLRYQASLYSFLALRAASAQDAEELSQEAFLRAWQRLHLYDARWRFSTWLFTLARRLGASRYRRKCREQAGVASEEPVALRAAEPDALAQRGEESQKLWCLAKAVLSPDQHSALWLRYGEDASPEEIGCVLGKRAASVRVMLFRARERLGQALRAEEEARAAQSAPAGRLGILPAEGCTP